MYLSYIYLAVTFNTHASAFLTLIFWATAYMNPLNSSNITFTHCSPWFLSKNCQALRTHTIYGDFQRLCEKLCMNTLHTGDKSPNPKGNKVKTTFSEILQSNYYSCWAWISMALSNNANMSMFISKTSKQLHKWLFKENNVWHSLLSC